MKLAENGSNPYNLTFRFILEVCALFAIGFWVSSLFEGYYKEIMGWGSVFLTAVVWGVFAVKNDPSRSGKTVVNTNGKVRLLIEFLIFALAVYGTYQLGERNAAISFAVFVVAHYALSVDRIKWLWKQ